MIDYINDESNGLRKSQKVGDYQVSVSYRPHALIVSKELKSKDKISDSLVRVTKEEFGQYQYFLLNISAGDKDVIYKGSSSFSEFSQRLQTLHYSISDYIYLTNDKGDTIRPADFYTPNFYGKASSTQIMVAFERDPKSTNNYEIHLKSFLPGLVDLSFQFKKEDMDEIPELTNSTGV